MSELAQLSDEDLLAAFVEADGGRREATFHELVDRYERRVYAIAYRYFGDHADAQDAAQETFLTVLRRAGTFRGESRFSTWLYRVTVNTCTDLARRRARRPATPVEDVGELTGDEDTAPDEVAGRELELEVQRALAQLDELSRALVILVAIEGRPYEEVAAALDLPVGTVKSRVHRARARLADLLAEVADTPPGPSGGEAADAPDQDPSRATGARDPPG